MDPDSESKNLALGPFQRQLEAKIASLPEPLQPLMRKTLEEKHRVVQIAWKRSAAMRALKTAEKIDATDEKKSSECRALLSQAEQEWEAAQRDLMRADEVFREQEVEYRVSQNTRWVPSRSSSSALGRASGASRKC